MAQISKDKLIPRLLNALGLGDLDVTFLKVTIEPDQIVNVNVKFLMKKEAMKELVEVVKDYELVEKKEKVKRPVWPKGEIHHEGLFGLEKVEQIK